MFIVISLRPYCQKLPYCDAYKPYSEVSNASKKSKRGSTCKERCEGALPICKLRAFIVKGLDASKTKMFTFLRRARCEGALPIYKLRAFIVKGLDANKTKIFAFLRRARTRRTQPSKVVKNCRIATHISP